MIGYKYQINYMISISTPFAKIFSLSWMLFILGDFSHRLFIILRSTFFFLMNQFFIPIASFFSIFENILTDSFIAYHLKTDLALVLAYLYKRPLSFRFSKYIIYKVSPKLDGKSLSPWSLVVIAFVPNLYYVHHCKYHNFA